MLCPAGSGTGYLAIDVVMVKRQDHEVVASVEGRSLAVLLWKQLSSSLP